MEYDRRHTELRPAIKEREESVLSCRSKEATATTRISLLRELASSGNSPGLDAAPSYSRGRDETSRTEPDAPLEPAQLDFSCHASKETNKFRPTFGLRGEMDEFRRLESMYPSISSRELAKFEAFAKAVAAQREDGRGRERGEDNHKDTGDDRLRGRHSRPGGRPSAGPRWGEKKDSSCSNSDFSRRGRRRRSHRRRKEKNQDRSAEAQIRDLRENFSEDGF